MTRFVVSADLGRELLSLRGSAAICDNSGMTIGYFTPALDCIREPQISEEELARREKEPTFTTKEVLERLNSL